ncbi:UNVERIFIED_CONTAM: hypothetical protein Sindi_0149400 [Sesamum indicum]
MVSTSTLSLCSHPKINFGFQNKQRNELWTMSSTRRSSLYCSSLVKISPSTPVRIILRASHLKKFNIKAAASGSGGRSSNRGSSSRRVYKQAQAPAPVAPVKDIVSFVLPAGAFVVVTFVLWKLVEKILLPKPTKSAAEENKPAHGVKWSFAPGTNLLSSFGAKIERESKLRLNDFAKELRSFQSVDVSGQKFGDEGLFFLAESLAYNQGAKAIAEMLKKNSTLRVIELNNNFIDYSGAEKIAEALKQNRSVTNVDLGGNDIHAKGISEIARVLKDNSIITTLELSYNPIGPEGAKALAEVLKFHGNIKDLMLGWCQSAVTDASDHVYEMNEKELNIVF